MNPIVSVIIPTYNRANSLSKTIQSVLNQTYTSFEIIVVDDGSVDDIESVVIKFNDKRIKYYRHVLNLGGSAARNTGIRNSIGKYIAFLDSDDEWLDNKLEIQVQAMENRSSDLWGGVCCGFVVSKLDQKKVVELLKDDNLKKEILNREVDLCAGSNLLISREVIDEIGFFDEKFKRNQDLEFLIRFFRCFNLITLREPQVIIHRERPTKIKSDTMLEVKELYLSKFESDIDELGVELAKEIRAKHWLLVANAYAVEKKYVKYFKYLRKSLHYKFLHPKAYLTPIITRLLYIKAKINYTIQRRFTYVNSKIESPENFE